MKQINETIIDANLPIYPVETGPYIISYNKYLKRLCNDMGYIAPDKKYQEKLYCRELFRKYMLSYRKQYSYLWYMNQWSHLTINMWMEGYRDSEEVFGDYLSGVKPYKFSQYFQLKYIKNLLKRNQIIALIQKKK